MLTADQLKDLASAVFHQFELSARRGKEMLRERTPFPLVVSVLEGTVWGDRGLGVKTDQSLELVGDQIVYSLRVEILDGEGKRLIAWDFGSPLSGDRHFDESLKAKNEALRTYRKLSKEIGALLVSGKPIKDTGAKRWENALDGLLEEHETLAFKLRTHLDRKSPVAKGIRAAWIKGDKALLTSIYGADLIPHMTAVIKSRSSLFRLLVSDRSNRTELFLKLAILCARQNCLKGESVPSVIRKLKGHLMVSCEQAAEILQLTVTPPGKGLLGYLGDFSPHSFALYLRRVKRRVFASESASDRDDDKAGRSAVHPHPWVGGTAALLSRIAIEYEFLHIRPGNGFATESWRGSSVTVGKKRPPEVSLSLGT